MYRIILANDFREAAAYARHQGWKQGTYRIATRASNIKGLRVAEIHQLPSFARRPDRHAFRAVLKHTRIPEWHLIDEDAWQWPPRPPMHAEPTVHDLEPGDKTTEVLEDVTCRVCKFQLGIVDPEPEPHEVVESEPLPFDDSATVAISGGPGGTVITEPDTKVPPKAIAGEVLAKPEKPEKPVRRKAGRTTPVPSTSISAAGF